MTDSDTQRAIDAVWRIESAKVIAGLTRIVKDVGLAEDIAHDALEVALAKWPVDGVPANPGAWLMTVAKNRAIDAWRRRKRLERVTDQLGHDLEADHALAAAPGIPEAGDEVGDDVLRLIFMTCHPALGADARVTLTLRLVGGLTTNEIARAFLADETAIQQRIVRAKKTLTDEQVPFEVPSGDARADRLASVLEVLYLMFNEGYAATAGDDWLRPALCEDALRLGRMLAELAPGEPEVHGLVALMEIQQSRARARTAPDGEPILLLDQNRARWDWLLVQRGLDALARAEKLAGPPGPYVLQAAIAACHGRARTAEATDWSRIAALYEQLVQLTGSPVVELNRAVAVGMAEGPAAGLAICDALAHEGVLDDYHLLPCVRADLLAKLGRHAEARAEYARGAAMTQNARERAVLLKKAAALPA